MFKPLEMVNVVLQVLHSDAARVTHVIAKQGLLHLLDSKDFSKYVGKVGGEEFQDTLTRYVTLDQELKELFKNLALARTPKKEIESDPAKDIAPLERTLQRIQKELSSPAEQLKRIAKQQDEKTYQLQLYRSILAAASDLELTRKFAYFYKTVGFIATKDMARFESSLGNMHFILLPLVTLERRTLIVVLASKKNQETLERALTSTFFERVELPDLNQGSFEQIIKRTEQELTELAHKKIQLSQQLKDTQKDVMHELQELREKVALALVILKAELIYGKGSRSYIIVGWVPKQRVEAFKTDILKVTEHRARFEFSAPEQINEVRQGKLKIPILFNNPYLIRPFESLVFSYGTQDYKEIDPTPIVAISFLLMFGMMFGDIGHGLILFLIGYGMFHKFYQYLDFAIIMMECGVSSMFFGLLYGSIFGVEHWIPALWMHPAENINHFMSVAVGFGVLMVSTGIILNIVNVLRKKDYETFLLGHYGIVGGLFYWTMIGLGVKYAVYGKLGLTTEAVLVILGIPLGIIFFREPLGHLIFKKDSHGEKLFPAGIAMFLMESIIDLVDVVIRYLASTVSFVRTAAFALAHGGLFIAVFSLAEMLGQLKGGSLWYWIVILLGNVLIIALEGLVVSIQAVRLEYYEFFTKFFNGGGERFQPLKME